MENQWTILDFYANCAEVPSPQQADSLAQQVESLTQQAESLAQQAESLAQPQGKVPIPRLPSGGTRSTNPPTQPGFAPEFPARTQPQTKRRKGQTDIACLPCRKRKIKCDGAETCNHCVRRDSICVYVEPDYRDYLKKKFYGAQMMIDMYLELQDAIQNRSETDALYIFCFLRAGFDVSTIVFFIKQGGLDKPPGASSESGEGSVRAGELNDFLRQNPLFGPWNQEEAGGSCD